MQTIGWRSPSNIALVKYWGKHGQQLPRNASISLTLREAYTDMRWQYAPNPNPTGEIALDFKFEGVENEKFRQKILRFLQKHQADFPFLSEYSLRLESSNSFPHSAGIASSASSMSALALCLCEMSQQVGHQVFSDESSFLQTASHWARLASGSAARSLFAVAAVWGASPHCAEASDLYAIPYQAFIHPIFASYHDDILLVSKREKSVSSTAGHQLMEGNPFAAARYAQAETNLGDLLEAMRTADLDRFGMLVEEEALTLHALMFCSRPSFILLEPNSLLLIQKIRAWRTATKLPLYFTIDAGPNLHLLYPDSIAEQVAAFINAELLPHSEGCIRDGVGAGAQRI